MKIIIDVVKEKKINQKTVHRLLNIFIFSSISNLMIGGMLFFSFIHPREPDYFITTINGYVEKLISLNEPNTSDSVVRQWSNLAVMDTFTYDFVNYEKSLEQVSQYFTDNGWYTFLRSLNDSNNLPTVIRKKLVVSAVAIKPPSILMKGYVNGVYSWRIQIPMLVTYQSASEFMQQNLLVTLLVSRISTLENSKGLGIEQFIVSQYADDTNTTI